MRLLPKPSILCCCFSAAQALSLYNLLLFSCTFRIQAYMYCICLFVNRHIEFLAFWHHHFCQYCECFFLKAVDMTYTVFVSFFSDLEECEKECMWVSYMWFYCAVFNNLLLSLCALCIDKILLSVTFHFCVMLQFCFPILSTSIVLCVTLFFYLL